MANINDMIFLTQLFIIIAITLYRTFNLMNRGQIHINKEKGGLFAFSVTIIFFIIILLCYLFGLYIVLLEYTNLLYSIIFNLEGLLLLLNVLFLFVEFFLIINLHTTPARKSNKSIMKY